MSDKVWIVPGYLSQSWVSLGQGIVGIALSKLKVTIASYQIFGVQWRF